jgi:hypothetical protein
MTLLAPVHGLRPELTHRRPQSVACPRDPSLSSQPTFAGASRRVLARFRDQAGVRELRGDLGRSNCISEARRSGATLRRSALGSL